MAAEITVANTEEFEQLVKNHDINIANAITETILENLKGRKKHLHALSVLVEEEASIYDITISRDDFKDTLTKQLPAYEKLEKYETCAEIVKAVKYLEEKKK